MGDSLELEPHFHGAIILGLLACWLVEQLLVFGPDRRIWDLSKIRPSLVCEADRSATQWQLKEQGQSRPTLCIIKLLESWHL